MKNKASKQITKSKRNKLWAFYIKNKIKKSFEQFCNEMFLT